ncbi:MAG: hypothetical protein ACRDHL_05500, partial [Candidatus Promineifilaceae bacterium]
MRRRPITPTLQLTLLLLLAGLACNAPIAQGTPIPPPPSSGSTPAAAATPSPAGGSPPAATTTPFGQPLPTFTPIGGVLVATATLPGAPGPPGPGST